MPHSKNKAQLSRPFRHKYLRYVVEPSTPGEMMYGQDHFGSIDWEEVIKQTDWKAIFDTCWGRMSKQPRNPEEFGATLDEDIDIYVHRWDLSLTHADWQVIRRKLRKGYWDSDRWRFVLTLQGNLIYVLDDFSGECFAIVRVSTDGTRYSAIELALFQEDEDALKLNGPYIAEALSSILPGQRFSHYWPEYPDEDWFWREPGDPGYVKARPQEWHELKPFAFSLREDKESFDLVAIDDEGEPTGPLKWSDTQFSVIRRDKKLCKGDEHPLFCWVERKDEAGKSYGELYVSSYSSTLHLHFIHEGNEWIASSADVYGPLAQRTSDGFHDNVSVCVNVKGLVDDLIDRKLEWREAHRRKPKQASDS